MSYPIEFFNALKLNTKREENRTFNLETILSIVSDVTKITVEQIKSPCRVRAISDARSLFIYIARKYTHCSTSEIGRYINRTHCTVIHNTGKVKTLLDVDYSIILKYNEIRDRLDCEISRYVQTDILMDRIIQKQKRVNTSTVHN